ncbi:MAG: hypothetical protein FH748_03905 [Balneolaceae bacterium]|nr:hypothetical protein [Balneolaceae bacterium]
MKYHKLLQRQIKKSIGTLDTASDKLKQLLKWVSQAYNDFEEDRSLLERSLELTSSELVERNNSLQAENAKLIEVQEKLIQKEKKLKASVDEKEILLQEIHHRVKNNLAVISGLLYLQAETEAEGKAKSKLQETQSRIHSMSMIHEMLYENKSFSSINMEKYLYDLVQTILNNFRPEDLDIDFQMEAEALIVDMERAIPIALLTNEVTINSLKYAYPVAKKGIIKIKFFRLNKSMIQLVISDNGIGLPDSVDLENPTSLGYMLIKAFVDQLRGTLDMDTSSGTEFKVTFPMSLATQRKNKHLVKKIAG